MDDSLREQVEALLPTLHDKAADFATFEKQVESLDAGMQQMLSSGANVAGLVSEVKVLRSTVSKEEARRKSKSENIEFDSAQAQDDPYTQ